VSGVERLNPSGWSAHFRYDQAQVRPAPARVLTVAGQTALDEQAQVRHPDDAAAQLPLAVAAVEELLGLAGMGWGDVLSLTVHTTDVDAVLGAYSALTDVLDAAEAAPPATLVGVTRLAVPGLAVEVSATAGR